MARWPARVLADLSRCRFCALCGRVRVGSGDAARGAHLWRATCSPHGAAVRRGPIAGRCRRRSSIGRRRLAGERVQSRVIPVLPGGVDFAVKIQRAQGSAWLYLVDFSRRSCGRPPVLWMRLFIFTFDSAAGAHLVGDRVARAGALRLFLSGQCGAVVSAQRRGGAARDGASAACAGLHGDAGGDATPVCGNARTREHGSRCWRRFSCHAYPALPDGDGGDVPVSLIPIAAVPWPQSR